MRLSSLVRFVLCIAAGLLLLVIVASGCGRTSLEPEQLDGGSVTPPNTCNAETCPSGCCDASGQCRLGTDTRACGTGGKLCSDCVAQGFDTCDMNLKACGRTGCSDCNGCCDRRAGTEICRAGADGDACGRFGNDCINCSMRGRACDPSNGQCGAGLCNAMNCPGCCVGDKCLAGNENNACGQGGAQCASCSMTGQTCTSAIGGGGMCTGTPTCNAGNCGGCCFGTTCAGGADNTACGKGGQACANCSAIGDVCEPTGQPNERTCQPAPTCGPSNCKGCCAGNTCIANPTTAECGIGGKACVACGMNQTCTGGTCQNAGLCNPGNCGGCCVGDICAVGTQDNACGVGGMNCANCGAMKEVCQGGACAMPACSAATCPNGCCQGNVCVVGTQDNGCGNGGRACSDCTAGGQVCQNRACHDKCSPANCVGCCTNANQCSPGIANNNCGSGGMACQNCSAMGSTCDLLVTPPVCTNQQMTCPSPYGGCDPATTTPVTAQNQGLCSDLDLQGLPAACQTGATSASCVAALNAISAVAPACGACLQPFDVDFFPTFDGIFLCVAPFVSSACNHSTGCDFDCTVKSCNMCVAASVETCEDDVQNGGQCDTFATQAQCAVGVLGPGQPGRFCNPNIYPMGFGAWLQGVGKHFCGGP